MSNSSLVSVNVPAHSSNYTVGRRGRVIEMIAIHHMAGILSAKVCGGIFQRQNRGGSSHYGIGKDAEIGQYVDEANTAWTNSNWDSNCKSVTIEVSNCEVGGNWAVSDNVLNVLIKLVADIAKRNNLGTLVKGKNVVWHSMYVATTCPRSIFIIKVRLYYRTSK
jgi:N-acetyl-anhydromuramyl-L-alanine amidase AmpD